MLTLRDNEFYDTGKSKPLGVTAVQQRGRWQYRDTDTGHLYASGMTPARFAQKFWFRDDYEEEA